jgi:predicted small lipoprotein YifL
MRSTTRFIALALAGFTLAACGHKDKDAPLAFVPADTPYVIANLDTLDDSTRQAMLAQADAQLPSQLAQMNAAADRLAVKDPDGARLLRAVTAEFKDKTIESFAASAGVNLKGLSAFYGLGLAPVARVELTDPAAFDSFVGRLETAYGKKFDTATAGSQSYRKYVSSASGTEVIVATVGKQAVAALLPGDASPAMLRQALGLDRPQKSLADDGRLAALAKAKGYQSWLVGDMDMTRLLPLALGGQDPLVTAMLKASASAESAKTGEPVANQLQTPPSCATEASRIAARVPAISFGYTKLDAKHQDMRMDVALADDISKSFADLKVELPGLGSAGSAPFDLTLALPIAQMRAFWSAQADAVVAKPFTCPKLTDLNDSFAKLGPAMQKAAIPPFGDMLGLRIALDTLAANKDSVIPTFSGRLVIGNSNPAGLLATGQMMVPALAQLRVSNDGKPAQLPASMTAMVGQPAWVAMSGKAIGFGIGAGEDSKLESTLKEATGDAGRMMRMHLSGSMYLTWLELMEDKVDSLAAATAAMTKTDQPAPDGSSDDTAAQTAANVAQSKAQFAAMKAQAERVDSIDAELHVDSAGLVITSQTVMK